MNEWVIKTWYVYKTKDYLPLKKNEIIKSVKTWKDLECMILSEVTQSQKGKQNNLCVLPHADPSIVSI